MAGKIDKAELLELAQTEKPDGSRMSGAEIAKVLGVSKTAVNKALRNIPQEVLQANTVSKFRENRLDIYYALLHKATRKLAIALDNNKVAPTQLNMIIGTIHDKINLMEGKATAHVAHVSTQELDPDVKKALLERIKSETNQRLVESRKKALEIK